ncbi:MAG: YccF domain-containing protein [Bdellovibrionaceae bacterium]|nr:YccF domain-containing protein [Pseudobdellovibrionaceae bacterium]
MTFINLLMNILWLVFGGWSVALSWFFASFIMAISIIGIPWARAAFNIALLNLWPFGSKVVERAAFNKTSDIGSGFWGLIGNIIWVVFAGFWLFLLHVFYGLLFCITIIGIPFGLQHFKLAMISFMPIGKKIVW